ncbi:MAG: 50S ribosomal protein L25/general stress protein Ctc [Deltaproteobacteria bacterium]|nr:50S ribosomal protein L25/general stress protein Ctc [Deltaproteobacteria bacterium]
MAQMTLSAQVRTEKGKGAGRKLRRDKRVPAVFYGPKAKSIMLSVSYSDLQALIKSTTSENIILKLLIESGENVEARSVILKELQTDPIKPFYYHADFYEIAMDKELTLNIALHLIGTPAGIIKGGMLQHVKRDLQVSCLPGNMVESIDVDVSSLDIGDSVHVKDIVLPDGIKLLEEEDEAVAIVVAPYAAAEEVKEAVEEEGEGKADAEASES